ncbi:hypothetical protein ES703_110703 [subsurface metagenome]
MVLIAKVATMMIAVIARQTSIIANHTGMPTAIPDATSAPSGVPMTSTLKLVHNSGVLSTYTFTSMGRPPLALTSSSSLLANLSAIQAAGVNGSVLKVAVVTSTSPS